MKDVRRELNFAARMQKAMLGAAIDALAEVRELHFAIEKLYMAAMNFDAKETFTKIFCRELFGLQNN